MPLYPDHPSEKAGLSRSMAHPLSSGSISYLTHSGFLITPLHNLFIDLATFSPQSLPSNFDQLCLRVVEGVKFQELFQRLAGSDADGDQVIQEVIETAGKVRT